MIVGPSTALVWAPMGIMFAGRHRYTGVPLRTGNRGAAAIALVAALAVVAFHAFVGVTLG